MNPPTERVDRQLGQLLADACAASFQGWDFSWLGDRHRIAPTDWDFRSIVETAARDARSVVDMGTGGGEYLATLNTLPPHTVATESHAPNWSS